MIQKIGSPDVVTSWRIWAEHQDGCKGVWETWKDLLRQVLFLLLFYGVKNTRPNAYDSNNERGEKDEQ